MHLSENGPSITLASLFYDGEGRRDQLARDALGAMTGYGYDPISRLSSLSHDLDGAGAANDATFGFAYNPASQITTRSLTNNAYEYPVTSSTRSYAVNGRNQYTQVGGVGHAWDANGNLTSDGATTFGYDTENRLVSASGAKNASLAYDPLGRLYQVTSGTNTTRFVYDGDRLIAEYSRRRHPAAPLRARRRGRRAAHLVRGGVGLLRQPPPPACRSSGLYRGHQQCRRGQARDPHLRPLRRHPGQQHRAVPVHRPGGDPRTGTAVLQGAGSTIRALGRFMQTDPIGYEDDVNLYAYVGNDPVNAIDPSGKACIGANGWSDYCRRAYMYGRVDQVLGNQTRFFAAASVTVQVLANLDIPGIGRLAASAETRAFLSDVSGKLEALNKQVALAVESGRLTGSSLDARIVGMEQTAVQASLDTLQANSPEAYKSVIAGANALLNPSGTSGAAASFYRTDAAYGRILDGVRKDLGRDIDFANQSDREAIGNAVISHIRRTGGCDVTGTRIKSC